MANERDAKNIRNDKRNFRYNVNNPLVDLLYISCIIIYYYESFFT